MSGLDLPSLSCESPGMERLDRLGWAAGVCFTIFGVRIGIRVNGLEFLAPLTSRLPLGSRAVRSTTVDRLYSVMGGGFTGPQKFGRRFTFLFGNAQELARTTTYDDLCEAFESDLDFYVGQTTRTKLFVHAGVVSWKGRAIIIPGRSHSGKTTLVQALLEVGATYYSDEFAVFDREGSVHAFPRPLSVRTKVTTTKIAAAQLGAKTGCRSLPVGLVILTRYKPGARWRPQVLSPGKGVLGLLQNTLVARRYPQLAFTALERVICRACVLGSARGDARETAEMIARYLTQATA